MNKAIVYYSKTGNTESVVKRFEGFDVLNIEAESDDPNVTDPVLTLTPKIDAYDYLVFASPVHGFQLCKIMKAYLKQVSSLEGKQIDLFVTHHFRFAFLGGKQALNQMETLVNEKNGEVRFKTSVNWKSGKREQVIKEMINKYK